jgi:hypothetical protein
MGIARRRVTKYHAEARFFLGRSPFCIVSPSGRSHPQLKLKNSQLKLSNNSQNIFCWIFLLWKKFGILQTSFVQNYLTSNLYLDLRTPTKKPGFLSNLGATTKYSVKKPGFWVPTPTKKPGFLSNLGATTKYSVKKPGFWVPMRQSYSDFSEDFSPMSLKKSRSPSLFTF